MKNALLFLIITSCIPNSRGREACYAVARRNYDVSANSCLSVETCDWVALGERFQKEQEACQ